VHIYCDFDGTITAQDTTDAVLRDLARPEWESLEAAWLAGRISAAECMRKQIALIQGDDAALEAILGRIELRAGFESFARWCKEEDLPLIVVSDGVDFMIRHILNRHGLGYLPVFANQLAGVPGARVLDQPWAASACLNKSGVCKCGVTRAGAPNPLVYIGDGRSDFCIAGEADVLFARSTLARHCVDQGLPFIAYDNFSDVQRYLFLMRLDGRSDKASAPLDHVEGSV
jgi:2,3-diketo-5-methylthio-1-phosphopentane phosphatase